MSFIFAALNGNESVHPAPSSPHVGIWWHQANRLVAFAPPLGGRGCSWCVPPAQLGSVAPEHRDEWLVCLEPRIPPCVLLLQPGSLHPQGHVEALVGSRASLRPSPNWRRDGGADRSGEALGQAAPPWSWRRSSRARDRATPGEISTATPRGRVDHQVPSSPPDTLFRRGGTAGTASQPQARQREPSDGQEDAVWTPPGRPSRPTRTPPSPWSRRRYGRPISSPPAPLPRRPQSPTGPAYSTSSGSPASSSLCVMNDGSFSTAFWSSSTPTTA